MNERETAPTAPTSVQLSQGEPGAPEEVEGEVEGFVNCKVQVLQQVVEGWRAGWAGGCV